jgi:hypothetical protein
MKAEKIGPLRIVVGRLISENDIAPVTEGE